MLIIGGWMFEKYRKFGFNCLKGGYRINYYLLDFLCIWFRYDLFYLVDSFNNLLF